MLRLIGSASLIGSCTCTESVSVQEEQAHFIIGCKHSIFNLRILVQERTMGLGTSLRLGLPVALCHIPLPGKKMNSTCFPKKTPPAPLVLEVPENAVRLGALPCQPIGAHLTYFNNFNPNPSAFNTVSLVRAADSWRNGQDSPRTQL